MLGDGCRSPTENRVMDVETLERQIGIQLPDDYRCHLSAATTFQLDATHWYRITERTPFGDKGGIDRLLTLKDFAKEGINGFPDVKMLIIGDNLFGYTTCICLDRARYGHVFYYDFEQRSLWAREQFFKMFPDLSEDIKQYIQDRDLGLLPKKQDGFESFYHTANSFSGFIAKLERENTDD